jgi:DNA repair photolyase
LESILTAARGAGAIAANYISLRLPLEVSALFQDWLGVHFPDRAAKVMARVRELHGGRDYDPTFGKRMRGQGIWADLLARRFQLIHEKLGFTRDLGPLRQDLFAPPCRVGDQMSLGL